MSRFAYERAIRRSGLPARARHIALTLATWADVTTCVIPDRYMPSLATLSEATGMGKSTIARYLPVLEDEGWIARRQRTGADRANHEITHYTLLIPASAQAEEPEEEVVPERDKGLSQSGTRVVPERDKGCPGAGHKSPSSSRSTSRSPRTATDAVISELAAATGRQIDDEWADRVAKQILESARGDVASPVAYVTKAIRTAADDGTVNRFLPTPGPTRFDPAEDLEEVLPPRPDPVMETAACGHLRVAGDDQECWLCAQEAADAAAGDAPQQPAAADSDHAAEPPALARPALTVHPGGNRPPRRGRNQPPLLTAVNDTPDDTPDTPGLPPELAERLARHRAGFAGRTRPTGATA